MVGDPVEIEIDAITWNAEIERHLARHGVDHGDVTTVVDNDPLTYRNLPDRGGSHVMIGPDESGRVLYISIRRTEMENAWEPVTGWESRLARRLWFQERGQQ